MEYFCDVQRLEQTNTSKKIYVEVSNKPTTILEMRCARMASYTAEVSRTMMWEATRQWSQRWQCEMQMWTGDRQVFAMLPPNSMLESFPCLWMCKSTYFLTASPFIVAPYPNSWTRLPWLWPILNTKRGIPKCPIFRRPYLGLVAEVIAALFHPFDASKCDPEKDATALRWCEV